jgi:Ca-activated chloride channel homolog
MRHGNPAGKPLVYMAIMRGGIPAVIVSLLAALAVPAARASAQDGSAAPTFRSSVDLVSVAAVVRDRRGQVVRNLTRDDFLVYDDGVPVPIVEFAPGEDGPVSVALLVDVSGSMRVGANLEAARGVIDQLLGWLRPEGDEVALFTFDSELKELEPFTTDFGRIRSALDSVDAFGTTSLYDAIDAAARRLGERATRRRALVVLTDGVDTSSQRSLGEVSGRASATDVPVYVVAVVSPADHAGAAAGASWPQDGTTGDLFLLSWWTGGTLYVVSAPAHASVAARALLAELRHQYVFAFEATGSGWRPLDIRLRRRDMTVKARSGYIATAARTE